MGFLKMTKKKLDTKYNPVLYILMRSDLASMNPGKMAAQACHAANKFTGDLYRKSDYMLMLFSQWQDQAKGQHFGTTIVLDVNDDLTIRHIIDELKSSSNVVTGIVLDETYPILDGKVMHTLPVFTCGYAFGDKQDLTALSNFGLYR